MIGGTEIGRDIRTEGGVTGQGWVKEERSRAGD